MKAGNGEWGMGNDKSQATAPALLALLPFPIPHSPFPAGGAGP